MVERKKEKGKKNVISTHCSKKSNEEELQSLITRGHVKFSSLFLTAAETVRSKINRKKS